MRYPRPRPGRPSDTIAADRKQPREGTPTIAHVNKLLRLAGLVPGKPGAKSDMKRIEAIKELLDIGYGKVR